MSIARCVDLDGFIDDFTSEPLFLGKPILKMREVPKASLVVSSVIYVMPLTAVTNLRGHGLDCVDYFDFFKYSGLPLKAIEFLEQARQDIEQNGHMYEWIYERLEDRTSKHVFEKLVNFRYSADLVYMEGFSYAPERQYFEDFLELRAGEVFVDGGGFDGQTSIAFIGRCPAYRAIYVFEPDPKNIANAEANLKPYRDIHIYPMGLAESCRNTRFSAGCGSASKVVDTGDLEIPVDSIDNLIRDAVSLIKMDIEGAEGVALAGSKQSILANHPKLAICGYHQVKDLWKIPQQILGFRDDYSVRVRHYTDGLHETVLYFLPNTPVRHIL